MVTCITISLQIVLVYWALFLLIFPKDKRFVAMWQNRIMKFMEADKPRDRLSLIMWERDNVKGIRLSLNDGKVLDFRAHFLPSLGFVGTNFQVICGGRVTMSYINLHVSELEKFQYQQIHDAVLQFIQFKKWEIM